LGSAVTSRAGAQDFTFIGSSSFSGVAGQLRVDTTNAGRMCVYGDVDGNGAADFSIFLDGRHALTASDFLF
jgi:hypothetical protein